MVIKMQQKYAAEIHPAAGWYLDLYCWMGAVMGFMSSDVYLQDNERSRQTQDGQRCLALHIELHSSSIYLISLAWSGEMERIICSACQHSLLIRGQVISDNLYESYHLYLLSPLPGLLSGWGIMEPCGTTVSFPPLSCQKLGGSQIKHLRDARGK